MSTATRPATEALTAEPRHALPAGPTGLVARVPGLIAGIVGTLSLVTAVGYLWPQLRAQVETPGSLLETFSIYYADIQPNLGWATVLLLVAAALAVRKRIAWWLVLVYTGFYLVLDVESLRIGDNQAIGSAIAHLLMLALLLFGYRAFTARVRQGAFVTALITLVVGLAVAVLLGWGLVELAPGTTQAPDRLAWSVGEIVGLGFGDADTYDGEPPGWVIQTLSLLSTGALVGAVAVLLRSRRGAVGQSAHDEAALRILIDRFGQDDSLAYFATRRDKSVVFSPDGLSAVAYRVEAGVCVASGDPIGDRASWDGAIRAWLAGGERYGWTPAVVGASKAGATAYHRRGMRVLDLGDEAVIETADFSLRGPAMTPVRQAVTRATRAGVRVVISRHEDLPAEELRRLGELADRWRGEEDERGFSMALGRWNDPEDARCLLVQAVVDGSDGPDGPGDSPVTVGLLSFVPWGATGVSLDVMRRSPEAPNGTFELMVSELCRAGDDLGIRRVSLNFAMFRSAFEEGAEIGAGPVLRLWRGLLLFLSRWWQLESLYKSNVRYHPHWVDRYLCFPDTRRLPQIGVAVGIAEGFLRRSRPRWDFRGATGEVASNAPSLASLEEVEAAPRPLPEQVRVRVAKAEDLAARGVDPWPVAVRPSSTIADAVDLPDDSAVSVAGRLLALRDFGGVVFGTLRDWSGDVQVVFERDRLGADSLADLARSVDLGDLLGVSGTMGTSRRGETSVLVQQWRVEAKCLHPMPDKRRGIADPEARVRQRYLDIAVNPQMRSRLQARSAVLTSLRSTLGEHGFLEVETPILQTIHGGANARPFQTHINAYDLDLYLRIAPELYLKRLCVGGMDRVFELGRTFRNEGVDFSHNPEFTILEAYEAHGDYRSMMDLTRELIQRAAVAANGSCVVNDPDGNPVDISGEWPVKTLFGAVSEALEARGGHAVSVESSLEELREQCDLVGVPWQKGWDAGAVALEMYEHLVEETTTRPTFYTDFPLSVSPLTRSHRSVPGVTERWDLVAWGVELGTAYSELTDPIEQRRRLTAQSEEAAGGDPEAMELDEEFLTALEYGMPPTGGLGIGVDRVVMLITGASIRETLPFPMTRPR